MKLAHIKGQIILSSLLVLAILVVVPGSVLAYGENADWTKAPGCGNPAPAKPWLYSAQAKGAGAVDLYWTETSGATSWTLAYGVKSGVYPYGIDRFGNDGSRTVRVSGLPSGTYYFALRANNDCMPGPFSNEQSASVGGGGGSPAIVATGLGTLKVTPTQSQGIKKAPSSGPGSVKESPAPKSNNIQNNQDNNKGTQNVPPSKPSLFQSLINFFLGLFK